MSLFAQTLQDFLKLKLNSLNFTNHVHIKINILGVTLEYGTVVLVCRSTNVNNWFESCKLWDFADTFVRSWDGKWTQYLAAVKDSRKKPMLGNNKGMHTVYTVMNL